MIMDKLPVSPCPPDASTVPPAEGQPPPANGASLNRTCASVVSGDWATSSQSISQTATQPAPSDNVCPAKDSSSAGCSKPQDITGKNDVIDGEWLGDVDLGQGQVIPNPTEVVPSPPGAGEKITQALEAPAAPTGNEHGYKSRRVHSSTPDGYTKRSHGNGVGSRGTLALASSDTTTESIIGPTDKVTPKSLKESTPLTPTVPHLSISTSSSAAAKTIDALADRVASGHHGQDAEPKGSPLSKPSDPSFVAIGNEVEPEAPPAPVPSGNSSTKASVSTQEKKIKGNELDPPGASTEEKTGNAEQVKKRKSNELGTPGAPKEKKMKNEKQVKRTLEQVNRDVSASSRDSTRRATAPADQRNSKGKKLEINDVFGKPVVVNSLIEATQKASTHLLYKGVHLFKNRRNGKGPQSRSFAFEDEQAHAFSASYEYICKNGKSSRMYASFRDAEHYIEFSRTLADGENCWYELYREGKPVRPIFDIDIDEHWDEHKKAEFLASFSEGFGKLYKECFKKDFDPKKLRVLESSNKAKTSFHIIICGAGAFPDVHVTLLAFAQELCCREGFPHVDLKVYSKNRIMRLINQCKVTDPERLMRPLQAYIDYPYLDFLASHTRDEEVLSADDVLRVCSQGGKKRKSRSQSTARSAKKKKSSNDNAPKPFAMEQWLQHNVNEYRHVAVTSAENLDCYVRFKLASPAHCFGKGAPHRHAHAYIVLKGDGTVYQRCYDKTECPNFEKKLGTVPQPMLSAYYAVDENTERERGPLIDQARRLVDAQRRAMVQRRETVPLDQPKAAASSSAMSQAQASTISDVSGENKIEPTPQCSSSTVVKAKGPHEYGEEARAFIQECKDTLCETYGMPVLDGGVSDIEKDDQAMVLLLLDGDSTPCARQPGDRTHLRSDNFPRFFVFPDILQCWVICCNNYGKLLIQGTKSKAEGLDYRVLLVIQKYGGDRSRDLFSAYFNRHLAIITGEASHYYVELKFKNGRLDEYTPKRNNSDLINSYNVYTFEEEGKTFVAIKEWMADPRRQTFNRVVFLPYASGVDPAISNGDLNLFQGYAFEYDPDFVVDQGKIQRMLNHAESVLCDGDPASFKYLLDLLGCMIQHPDQKLERAVICAGGQGIGKNLFWEHFFGRGILGDKYFSYINNINDLQGQFTSYTCLKLMVLLDEVDPSGARSSGLTNKLKSLITAPYEKLERKNKDAIEVDSFSAYILLSNNYNCISIDPSDRRYFALWASSKHANDAQYLNLLAQDALDEEIRKHFFHFLMRRDVGPFKNTPIPPTKYRSDLIAGSLGPCVPFVQWLVKQNNEHVNWRGNYIASGALYKQYQRFCEETGTEETIKGWSQLSKSLQAAFPNTFTIHHGKACNSICFNRELLDRVTRELERQNLNASPPKDTCCECKKATVYQPSPTKMCHDCCEKELMIRRDRDESQDAKDRAHFIKIREENVKLKLTNAKLQKLVSSFYE